MRVKIRDFIIKRQLLMHKSGAFLDREEEEKGDFEILSHLLELVRRSREEMALKLFDMAPPGRLYVDPA